MSIIFLSEKMLITLIFNFIEHPNHSKNRAMREMAGDDLADFYSMLPSNKEKPLHL